MGKRAKFEERAPLFRALRKVINAAEDMVDDTIDRFEGAEKDLRKAAANFFKAKDEDGEEECCCCCRDGEEKKAEEPKEEKVEKKEKKVS